MFSGIGRNGRVSPEAVIQPLSSSPARSTLFECTTQNLMARILHVASTDNELIVLYTSGWTRGDLSHKLL